MVFGLVSNYLMMIVSVSAADLPTEDEDDPEADPEYNVLAEPENEEDHILPVRVPSE